MKISIISLAIFALCLELPACTNARSFQPVLPENYLLLLTEHQFFAVQNSDYDIKATMIGIEDYPEFSEAIHFHEDMTFRCGNNNMYLLNKAEDKIGSWYNPLDAFNFNDNNKLKRIDRNKDVFDGAVSITFDWTTKLLYWTERKNYEYSIKVTDESFENINYVINPQDEIYIGAVRVYPKRNELFFISGDEIWYTSTSPSSVGSSLYSTEKYPGWVYEISIDYATDKLYWFGFVNFYYMLHSANIASSARPFNDNDLYNIKRIVRVDETAANLVAFNYAMYWTETKNDERKLIFKSGYDKAFKVIILSSDTIVSFVSSTCPTSYEKKNGSKYDPLETNEI